MTKYLLKRIEKEIVNIQQKKQEIEKIKDDAEINAKDRWLSKKRKGFHEICILLGLDEQIIEPLKIALFEMIKDIYDYVISYFDLLEKYYDELCESRKLENELVITQTLLWFQRCCITGDLTRIVLTPELYEMFTQLIQNNILAEELFLDNIWTSKTEQ